MKKRLYMIMAAVILLASLSFGTEAATMVNVSPELSFSGSTANCSVRASKIGKTITLTMELWHGTTLVDSWSGSGTNSLTLSENHSGCVSGWTYTLKINGTIGGVAFSEITVTATC